MAHRPPTPTTGPTPGELGPLDLDDPHFWGAPAEPEPEDEPEDDPTPSFGPYHTAAPTYFGKEHHPIPVVGKSGNVPTSFTGHAGRLVTRPDMVGFMFDRPDDNIALRLVGVIGIDVDDYEKDGRLKRGAATLAIAEAMWGPLPATWRSSSRGPCNPSGIRYYRVPENIKFQRMIKVPDPETGEALSDIDIIQQTHRYAIVWPSIHPDTGAEYRWYGPGGELADEPPAVADFPELPARWIQQVENTKPAAETHPATTPVAPQEAPQDAWHPKVAEYYQNGLTAVGGDVGGRHDNTGEAIGQLARAERHGWAGATTAINMLRDHFIVAIGTENHQRNPAHEYDSLAKWYRDLVATSGSTLTSDQDEMATIFGHLPPYTQRPAAAAGTDDPAPEAPPPPAEPTGFWETPQLAHAKAEAEAAGCNPITVLNVVLARVNTILAPRWRTGRARGINPGSLNIFVALIGPPGAGKTRHAEVPRGLIPHPVTGSLGREARWFKDRARPGSAAGLARIYAPPGEDKDGNPLPQITSCWCEYDEASQLLTLRKRNGEPIVPELCSAWAGGDLSTQLADPRNSRTVPAGSYGLGLSINLQTVPAAELYASQDIGLPQRFLWSHAAPSGAWDPDAWDDDIRPVRPIPWREPEQLASARESFSAFVLPDVARRELHALTNPDRPPLADSLDVHHPYLQSKLACALAGLHGRSQVTDDDWGRARFLVDTSAAVRRGVQAEVAAQAAAEQDANRRAKAYDAVAVERAVTADRERQFEGWVTSARAKLLADVKAAGAVGASRSELRRLHRSDKRGAADEALRALLAEGKLTESSGRVRLGVDR